MKKIFFYSILFLVVAFFGSCKKQSYAKFSYETNPKFVWGFAQFYGDYYSNYDIPNNVVTLHLFSEGLYLSDGHLAGKGQDLVLEDVFLPSTDTLLAEGIYKSAYSGKPFTFFAGEYIADNTSDENISGAYLYYIQSEQIKAKAQLIPKGKMKVDLVNDSIYTLNLSLKTADSISIIGTYQNTIPHFDLSAHLKESVAKNHKFRIPIDSWNRILLKK